MSAGLADLFGAGAGQADGQLGFAAVVEVDVANRVRTTTLGERWLPLDGFPEHWVPKVGDRVVVTDDDTSTGELA